MAKTTTDIIEFEVLSAGVVRYWTLTKGRNIRVESMDEATGEVARWLAARIAQPGAETLMGVMNRLGLSVRRLDYSHRFTVDVLLGLYREEDYLLAISNYEKM